MARIDRAVPDSSGLLAPRVLTRVFPPYDVPTGRAARVRHPDGVLVEYLEHRRGPDDVDEPGLTT